MLDERLAPTTFVGLALIVVGVWVVNGGGLWLAQRLRGEREPVGPEPVGPEPLGGTGQQPTGE